MSNRPAAGKSNLLCTPEQIEDLAQRLRREKFVAFDTEFIRESTFYPTVEIIQVATREESWLVDAQAFKKGFRHGPKGGFNQTLKPLLDVFEDREILKILHAAQGDQECLYTSYGIVAVPTLDTAVAASLCGYGEGLGLGKLLKNFLGVTISKGHARTNWSQRPLPKQLEEYAHADVRHLVELGEKLLAQLEDLKRREWALALSAKWEDKALYEPEIGEMALKLARGGRLDKKGHAVLLGLIRWREERVRHLNLPRRWVADDAVLVDLAHVRPKDLEHLSSFRGLNKGEIKNSGEAILAAIRKGSETEESTYTRGSAPDIPSLEESQVLDLVKCYIGILADQHRISARHLATVPQLLPLLRHDIAKPEDLVTNGILGQEAAALIGKDLISFLKGECLLQIQGTQIKVVRASQLQV